MAFVNSVVVKMGVSVIFLLVFLVGHDGNKNHY